MPDEGVAMIAGAEKPAPDLYEVIWFAAFGHLEQAHVRVRASTLRATVLGIIKAIEASGLVAVSAELLTEIEKALTNLGVCDDADCDKPVCGHFSFSLLHRLRAALPERTENA